MKLLLTSSGLINEKMMNAFQSLLTKPAKDVRVVIMVTKPRPQFYYDVQAYVDEDRQKLIKLGILEKNIKVFELSGDNSPKLDDVDVLFMLGGNMYDYMKHIRRHGLDSEIIRFVDRGGVYVGRSAGAIIMGPDVDTEYWSDSTNWDGLEDTSGLGCVDFMTVPHIGTRYEPEKVIGFHKKTGRKMIYITDEQGILVIDNLYKII